MKKVLIWIGLSLVVVTITTLFFLGIDFMANFEMDLFTSTDSDSQAARVLWFLFFVTELFFISLFVHEEF